MGCIYSQFEDGKCEIWSKDVYSSGCDKNGVCVVEDDPNPEDSCEDFEEN